MQIEEQGFEKKWLVLKADGRIDSATAQAFEQACLQHAARSSLWLALDFSAVEYLSSAGLRSLLAVLKDLHKKGGGMALINPQGSVRDVLGIANFGSVFPIVAAAAELS